MNVMAEAKHAVQNHILMILKYRQSKRVKAQPYKDWIAHNRHS